MRTVTRDLPGEEAVAKQLVDYLAPATGWRLDVSRGRAVDGAMWIDAACTDEPVARLGGEGYALSVMPIRITVRASEANGAFYGVQTIRQLLPTEVFSPTKVGGVRWTLQSVMVSDAPRFGWRGLKPVLDELVKQPK